MVIVLRSLVLGLFTAALAVTPAAAAETLKIGFITSLSGPAGIIGKHMKDSVELALDHLGRKVGGLETEVIYGDDQRKPDVDINYVKLLRKSLAAGGYTAVATHDDRVIDHVINYTAKHGIGTERFEFQMLFGVRQKLQEELLLSGYPVLIATPYGPEWYYYLMRRMAERPANLFFVLRQAVSP